MAGLISRGFLGRRRPPEVEKRLPPGQYLVTDFPVLSAGPTPHTPLDRWSFRIEGLVPGLKYNLEIIKGIYFLRITGSVIKDLTIKSGETRDLGEVQAKPVDE